MNYELHNIVYKLINYTIFSKLRVGTKKKLKS